MSRDKRNPFEVVRKNNCIQIWIPPVNDPEGELVIGDLHESYIPYLISILKKFEQKEKRSAF